jgi:hypothetical protein
LQNLIEIKQGSRALGDPRRIEVLVPTMELVQAVDAMVNVANAYKVDSDGMFESIAIDTQRLKGLQKLVVAGRTSALEPIRALEALAEGNWKPYVDKCAKAEAIMKAKTTAYRQERENKRREIEARQREAARREQERLQKQADAAAARGKVEQAEALRERAANVPAQVFSPPATPKVKGVFFTEHWDYEIEDAARLPREYLLPDKTKIGEVVSALKGETRIPGVRVFPRSVMSSRSV